MLFNIKQYIIYISILLTVLGSYIPMAFAQVPESDNYKLQNFNFGAGGTDEAQSENYSLFGTAGEVSGDQMGSENYKLNPGLSFMIQAGVPAAPAFTNPANYYNRLKIVINNGDNPEDAEFAIAISNDNFATDTKYVQSDSTISTELGVEDWQTYDNWGGASGIFIIGLEPDTTYTAKVSARQGIYTQTGFGPTAQASTADVSLTFDIDVASTDSESDTPYEVALGDLAAGDVSTAADKVWIDLSTNADAGGFVYIYDVNAGLKSTNTNYTISSATANLDSSPEGFGAISSSTAQSGGGPLTAVSPYNGASNNVGVLDTTIRTLFSSSNSPISSGRGSFLLKAKSSSTTPSSNDYADTLTLISSATF